MTRTYSDLIQLDSFEDRFEYLSLRGNVGQTTFGFDRHLNQSFYTSREWRQIRHYVIARDEGCDLAVPGFDIPRNIIIHHMNPLDVNDIIHGEPSIIDPEFLITTTLRTHNAIHFGDAKLLVKPFVERRPGDTKLW